MIDMLQLPGVAFAVIGLPWLMWDKRSKTAGGLLGVSLICLFIGGALS